MFAHGLSRSHLFATLETKPHEIPLQLHSIPPESFLDPPFEVHVYALERQRDASFLAPAAIIHE